MRGLIQNFRFIFEDIYHIFKIFKISQHGSQGLFGTRLFHIFEVEILKIPNMFVSNMLLLFFFVYSSNSAEPKSKQRVPKGRRAEVVENNPQSNVAENFRVSSATAGGLCGLAAPYNAQSRRTCCIFLCERLGGGLQFVEVVLGWPRLPTASWLLGFPCDLVARRRVAGPR